MKKKTNKKQNPNQLIQDGIRVEWVELGEGLQGDYNPEDPKDVELLRFDISKKVNRKWEFLDDASYCTQVPVTATPKQRMDLLRLIMSRIYESVISGDSIKKICENLSWLDLESLKTNRIGLYE